MNVIVEPEKLILIGSRWKNITLSRKVVVSNPCYGVSKGFRVVGSIKCPSVLKGNDFFVVFACH